MFLNVLLKEKWNDTIGYFGYIWTHHLNSNQVENLTFGIVNNKRTKTVFMSIKDQINQKHNKTNTIEKP